MSERKDGDYVGDMLEAARRIAYYTTGLSYEAFLTDLKTQDAVIRNLEIIGEAVKHLSEGLRTSRADLPWKSMAGIRDKLIHRYFGVNPDIVWQVATADLPQMAARLSNLPAEDELENKGGQP